MALIQLETNRFTDDDREDMFTARNELLRTWRRFGVEYNGSSEDKRSLRVTMLAAIHATRYDLRDSELAELEAMIDAVRVAS